ncbi:hypothetical protein J8N05_18785 [Streptomyces sp. BH-SS-21]|uniref:Uncharacterized protein n=1 Tax=Streptomyces liliiviolaceus TaxID=2823109 RepID=A0A941B7A2_9ACTN|nr:hypothetical protein [Streptomyces liliiviolaceus]MBQ0850241.1 hypothetical protein [Streptomyces liliiviolaceus]
MDPITMAAATALISAMATDGWQRAVNALVQWWQRARPEQAETAPDELAFLHRYVLALQAMQTPSPEAEEALIRVWQARLAQLAGDNTQLRADLRQLAEDIARQLPGPEQERVTSVYQNAQADRRSKVIQVGGDVTINGE